jgi:hypothetical protein
MRVTNPSYRASVIPKRDGLKWLRRELRNDGECFS